MNDLWEAIELIQAHPDKNLFRGPQSDNLIKKAEVCLGFKFPPTYRAFLENLGAGSFGGEEFYGLVGSEDFGSGSIPDGVWKTLKDREKFNQPNYFYGFYALGEGTVFGLDTSRRHENDENPIISTYAGGPFTEESYEDFGEFFMEKIREEIEYILTS